MTIEEKIKKAALEYCKTMNYILEGEKPEDYSLEAQTAIDAFKVGVDWVLKNQWVCVEDGLPEFEKDVLVTDGTDVWFSHRTKRDDVWTYENGFCKYSEDVEITHWMEVPKIG